MTGVEAVRRVERDKVRKVSKGQTGLECPAEELASIATWSGAREGF